MIVYPETPHIFLYVFIRLSHLNVLMTKLQQWFSDGWYSLFYFLCSLFYVPLICQTSIFIMANSIIIILPHSMTIPSSSALSTTVFFFLTINIYLSTLNIIWSNIVSIVAMPISYNLNVLFDWALHGAYRIH